MYCLGVTHSKIDMDALIETMTVGRSHNWGEWGPVWTTADGADAFWEDATQWSDFDVDGYGDNGPIQNGMILMKKWASVNL